MACAGVDANSPDHAEITATATQSVRLTANRIREPAEKCTRDREQIAVGSGLTQTVHKSTVPDITVYWRPGCGFCGRLLGQLDHHGIAHRRINIWDDQDGAATVRSIARGNETVPTVVVGHIGLVNPSVQQILGAVDTLAAMQTLATDAEPVG